MKIIYCHHANRKKGNPPTQNDGITKLGVKDAKITRKLIQKLKNVRAIYTSQFYRCVKTAQILNTSLQLPIIIDNRLDEFKSVENETLCDLQNRVVDCLDDIYKKYDNEDVIICITSGVNIAGFICWNFNIKPSNDIPFLGVPSCSPISFEKEK